MHYFFFTFNINRQERVNVSHKLMMAKLALNAHKKKGI